MLPYNKKKLIIILIYFSFFIAIPIIESYESKIFIMEKNLLEASLEFQYLTSPAVLSSKIEKNFDQKYNSLDLSQIYLNIENFTSSQKNK